MTAQRRERHGSRDRGSGTVLMAGVLGLLVSLVVGVLAVVSAVVASHRAQAAADLAALAAASVLVRGEPWAAACSAASTVAGSNGGVVARCDPGADLSVQVVVEVPSSVARVGVATARSRAGPAQGPPVEPGG